MCPPVDGMQANHRAPSLTRIGRIDKIGVGARHAVPYDCNPIQDGFHEHRPRLVMCSPLDLWDPTPVGE